MDYRELLKKYIQLVVAAEGVDFISHNGLYSSYPRFTREEIEELKKLSKESDDGT